MDQGWHHTATSSLFLKQYAGSGDVAPMEDWLSSVHEAFGSQHGGTYISVLGK